MTSPLAPPQGGLSDDQLLAAAGPTDDQLLSAPGPGDDALLAAPGPSAPVHGVGLLSKLVGIGERGMVGGVDGLVNTAQAAGRWADTHLGNNDFLDRLDAKVDNLPIASRLDAALQADHPYAPQSAAGKIAQGVISGVTGAALSGGAGLIPTLTSGAVGAAIPTAKALGASDAVANDIGVGLSLLPVAGAAVADTRNLVGGAARSWAAGRAVANMTDADAVHTVLLNDALKQYQGAATGPAPTSFQAAGAYKKDLNGALVQYGRSGVAADVISSDTMRDLSNTRSIANAHTNALADTPGGSYDALQLPGALPDSHLPVVNTALEQLDRVSPQQFRNASAGPFASLAQKVSPAVAWGSALAGLAGGHGMGPVVDLALGGVGAGVGRLGGMALPAVGRGLDHLFGTAVTPAEAAAAGATRRVADNGLTIPATPLLTVRGLVNDNAQLAQANAQFAEAAKMNTQFDKGQSGDWQAMLKDAYATNADSNKIDAAHGAMLADLARRQNTADTAGNWMEQQARLKFQRDNPGVPITGADQLRSGADVFTATGGRYGSPAGATDQGVAGVTGPVPGQTGGAGQRVTPSPSASPAPPPPQPSQGATMAPGLPTTMGPPSLFAAPSGGQVLTQQVFRDLNPGRALPDTPDIHRAVGALGDRLDPLEAFKAAHGMNVDRDTAYALARHLSTDPAMAPATGSAAIPTQATAEVSSLMGGSSMLPNGGDRGPIQNLPRWQAAGANYQRHAANMMTLATSPAEKQAISQIAAIPDAAGKQAVRDAYQANNPGADLSRFTPQLMRGV